jgi:hypothetical protein
MLKYALLTLLAVPVIASATVIDFDDASAVAGSAVATNYSGVTFTNAQYTANYGLYGSSGSYGISSISASFQYIYSAADAISATFATSISSASIGVIDIGGNGFTLEAYDASNTLVDSATYYGSGAGVGDYEVLSVAGAGITTLKFYQPLSVYGDGVVLDNLTYQAVPEPMSIAALGLGAFALVRRRKSA